MDRPAALTFLDEGMYSLDVDSAEIEQIAALVITCPFIATNEAYRERAWQTALIVSADDDTVNAFAMDYAESCDGQATPIVAILGGAVRACKLSALALAMSLTHNKPEHFRTAMSRLGAFLRKNSAAIKSEDLSYLESELGLTGAANDVVSRKARSYFSAMVLSIIAHEVGHICLFHTQGGGTSLQVSRNQEREADSFASSVIAATPFNDYLCLGSAAWWILLTWVEYTTLGSAEESTHPRSRDRLKALIRDNVSQFAELGITSDSIDDILP